MSAEVLDPYPSGWYTVAFSDEVPEGEVRTVACFGQELVCWRTTDGTLQVVEPYCPHLGAHLGYGGRVEDDCIVCPFHEWRYDRSGRNVEIPYAPKPNPAARLHAPHFREQDGFVWVWYHPESAEPSWEPKVIPELSSPDFITPARTLSETVAHPQDIYENAVDMAHFVSVHKADRAESQVRLDVTGPEFVVTSEGQMLKSNDGHFRATVQSALAGLGLDVARISGRIDTVIAMCLTPVALRRTQVRFAVTARLTDRDGQNQDPDAVRDLAERAQKRVIREFEQDLQIWQHKKYLSRPKLAPSEKPITEYRRWASQFYADPAPEHTGATTS